MRTPETRFEQHATKPKESQPKQKRLPDAPQTPTSAPPPTGQCTWSSPIESNGPQPDPAFNTATSDKCIRDGLTSLKLQRFFWSAVRWIFEVVKDDQERKTWAWVLRTKGSREMNLDLASVGFGMLCMFN